MIAGERRRLEWIERMQAFIHGQPSRLRSGWLMWRGARLRLVSFRGGAVEVYRESEGLEEFAGYAVEVFNVRK